MPWHLEFYRMNPDGTRTGIDKVTDRSLSVEPVIVHAKSMMRHHTFTWGKANNCLIKNEDGNLVRGLTANA